MQHSIRTRKFKKNTHKKQQLLSISSSSSSLQQPSSNQQLLPTVYKRAVWTAASVGLCFAVVNATSMLQSQMCMFRWDRPETWAYTFALTGSPVCRMLSQTNSFFHRAAGNVLNIVF